MVFTKIVGMIVFALGIAMLCYGFSESKTNIMSVGIFLGIVGAILFFGTAYLFRI